MSTRYNGAFIIPDLDEAVDTSPAVEKECHSSCTAVFAAYEACAERIVDKPEGHCTGQYLDYFACIDHCAAGKKFAHTKG
ncbi:hypothetical protein T492DRAFT_995401 [Pavlovales sp. CCMP2436]|nr:hypothetical protein T492DRAFT_995401 [Pavlovales sp. CCMP2436]